MKPEYIIDHQIFEPPADLQPYIRYSIFIHFKNKGQNIWFPADLRNQLIYLMDGAANLEIDNQIKKQPKLSIRGTFNKPLNVSFSSEEVRVLCIEFTETALQNLFNISGEEHLNKIENPGKILSEKNFPSPDPKQDVKSIYKFFEKNLLKKINPEKQKKAQSFTKVIEICKEKRGQVTVEELSKIASIHKRTLNRYFVNYTGLSPKKYLHQLNVRRLLSEMIQTEKSKGSHLAEKYGLYDESHLIRIIRKYTGTSPKKLEDFDTSWFEFIRNKESKLS